MIAAAASLPVAATTTAAIHYHIQRILHKSLTQTHSSFTKQYDLVSTKKHRCPVDQNVTVGLTSHRLSSNPRDGYKQ